MQGTHCAVLTFLLTLLRVAAPRSTVNVQKEIVVKEEIPMGKSNVLASINFM